MPRNRQMSHPNPSPVIRREKPMMGAPGWESWSDSDSEREEDEELPSAEHQAALASIGEYTHDEDLYHARGMSSNPTTPLTPYPPADPKAKHPLPHSSETAENPHTQRHTTSLTESQLLTLAHLPGPEAEKMKIVFQHYNTHGLTSVLQRYRNPLHQEAQLDPPIQEPGSSAGPSHTTLHDGLSQRDLRHALADSKEEIMARIHQHMAKNMDKT
jgi:predicted small metal-binding protein